MLANAHGIRKCQPQLLLPVIKYAVPLSEGGPFLVMLLLKP